MSRVSTNKDYLSREETAGYLRLPINEVERSASEGLLHGHRVNDSWLFSRTAINDWLREHDSRSLFLKQAGALTGDDALPQMLDEIYARRERLEVEDAPVTDASA